MQGKHQIKRFKILFILFTFLIGILGAPVPAKASSSMNATYTLTPLSLVNLSGGSQGKLSALKIKDQRGKANNSTKYMLFTTPGKAYRGYRSYQVPLNLISSINSFSVKINYKGPAMSTQAWRWYAYNWETSAWVQIGNNKGARPNVWMAKTFTVSNPHSYINSQGIIRILLRSGNASYDAKIDYENIILSVAMNTEQVAFENSQNTLITGYVFRPEGTGPFPAVVMMHGCSGVFSNSDPNQGLASLYREWAARLVANGYVALLVDSFTPRDAEQSQCNNGESGVSEVNDRPHDAQAAYEYLSAQPFVRTDSIGLLGWSHGGSSTLATMDTTNINHVFKVAVAFYPGCGLYGAFGGLSESTWLPYAPFRIHHGTADTTTSPWYCQQRVDQAIALGGETSIPIDLVLYKDAIHSFDRAVEVGGNFTQADVNAKYAADVNTMKFFSLYLQP